MSTTAESDLVHQNGTTTRSKRKKSKKKTNGASKPEDIETLNGYEKRETEDYDEEDDEGLPSKSPTRITDPDADSVDDEAPRKSPMTSQANGTQHHSIVSAVALGISRSRSQQGLSPSPPPPADASARFDAIAKERDTLRQEVTELRQKLESIRDKHESSVAQGSSAQYEEEIRNLKEELDEANEGKEHFETQYKNLLGRVNTIKTSLGDRLKADTAKIEDYQSQVSTLEAQNRELQKKSTNLLEELARIQAEKDIQSSEVENVRSRTNLLQQNWIKERDELISREAYAREEFENAKQAMQDWEVLAMNERSLRENLAEKDAELHEQIESLNDKYEKAASDRDINSQAVEGLQKALQDVQALRKVELKTSVETYEVQLSELRKQAQAAEEVSKISKATVETTQKELERVLPFEKEVKEKNLLIGKLTHQAVTLNEHLTKALRVLKKGRPEENVDRQIITNYFLHFLSLDRSDPKKFEALQLIASLLGWTDEQREQAGLARPGQSSTSANLRPPPSPFRRMPSLSTLNSANDPMLAASSSNNGGSLAELWQDFLEREAAEGQDILTRGSSGTPPQ